MEKLAERFMLRLMQPLEFRQAYKQPGVLLNMVVEYLNFVEDNYIITNQKVLSTLEGVAVTTTQVQSVPTLVGFSAYHCLPIGELRAYINYLTDKGDLCDPEEQQIVDVFNVFNTICEATLLEGSLNGRFNHSIASIILNLKEGQLAAEQQFKIEVRDQGTKDNLATLIAGL
jgi:hypothetical protein